MESDFTANPIRFGDCKFDLVVAQGVFEYVGKFQEQKFAEIKDLLRPDGMFVVSYVNFDHLNRFIYEPYNNVLAPGEFRKSLERFFKIRRVIPTSHRWQHDEPRGRRMKALQMHVNLNIPLVSRLFAVEYFFICSLPKKSTAAVRS
jgi:SAM-dependent methyltransferase